MKFYITEKKNGTQLNLLIQVIISRWKRKKNKRKTKEWEKIEELQMDYSVKERKIKCKSSLGS